MACDICGKTGTSLNDLLTVYQVDGIKAVCPECEKVLNDRLSKLRRLTTSICTEWFKRFIRIRKGESHG